MRGKRLAAAVLLLLTLCACAQAASFDDDGLLRLVNREEKITKRYVPEGLVLPDVPTNKKDQAKSIYLRPEAAKALEEMFRAAREEKGYELLAVSGYRAFGLQQIMFNNKVEAVGSRERAWRTVAPAGASEHQLGLAMDLGCKKNSYLNEAFGDTPEGQWVNENCHRFGFIIRYKKEWTEITGYAFEPWHVRYVGKEHAARIHELDIPLEYYIAQLREAQYALVSGKE